MNHFRRMPPLCWVLTLVLGCDTSSSSPDAGADRDVPVAVRDAETENRDARPIVTIDATFVPFHDAGAPMACTESCDCPQGVACLDGFCRSLGAGPVYCCEKAGCPTGETCLAAEDRPLTCPAPRPDAGPAPDSGPRDSGAGSVGSSCFFDEDCDTSGGLSCWDEFEPPYLWDGYCTVDNCTPSCPGGSGCVAFNTGVEIIRGCMALCTQDEQCREDAYCRDLGNGNFVCYPKCRDDLYDCSPRNGSLYCNTTSGACEPVTTRNNAGRIGDACQSALDCGSGQICMVENVWGFLNGLCTKVCSGLPEAAPCGIGETCQDFAGLGLCFRDCDDMESCPDRPEAFCGTYFPEWPRPSCIP